MTAPGKTCLITGVGPGTGSALAKRFAAAGYRIAMLARDEARLRQLEANLPDSRGFVCDVGNEEQLRQAVAKVQDSLGDPHTVIHNAVSANLTDFMSLSASDLRKNFETNTIALLHLAQLTAPSMIKAGEGVIMATGNTSAYRGKANFAGFAPTKASQRILLESMARSLGPQGVHVAYVAIDAVIDVPWTREAFNDRPDDFFCQPADIAEECFRLANQAKSAWSFESMIRPFGENW